LVITHEEPGVRLELAETESRFWPLLFGLGATAIVATPWSGVWAAVVHGAGLASIDWVPTALWAAGGLFLVVRTFGGHRLESFSVDRGTGRVEWRRSHVLGLVRWGGAFPLESLGGFALALASKPGGSAATLRLALAGRGEARERRFELRVHDLGGGTERIAELGLRMAAAAGLPYYRVTLSEGGRFAMQAAADARPEFERVPSTAGGAEALDRAAADAATHERLPPFDPASFVGDARVTVWEPGRSVTFVKRWGPSVLLSPLLLAAALGPLCFFRLPSLQTMPLLPRAAATFLLTFAGLGLAVVGWAGLDRGLPRRVRLDWGQGTLRVEAPRRRRTVPLAAIEAVEQRNKSYATGRVRGGMVRTSYWCQVRLRLREPADPRDELLIETRTFPEDKAAPRQMAVPLARELAAALRVAALETGPS
jgi:hypothetical protein